MVNEMIPVKLLFFFFNHHRCVTGGDFFSMLVPQSVLEYSKLLFS